MKPVNTIFKTWLTVTDERPPEFLITFINVKAVGRVISKAFSRWLLLSLAKDVMALAYEWLLAGRVILLFLASSYVMGKQGRVEGLDDVARKSINV